MSTTSEGGSAGTTQWGSDPTAPMTSGGSSSGSAATQTRSSSSGDGSNGSNGSAGGSTTYYGSNGASFDSGSQAPVGGGASAPNTSGAETGGTPLTRGAVTTQTAPTKKVAPAAAARPAARKARGPRRVRLAVARMDPWSVMKMSFLLSVALGIAGVILTAVLWMILSTMNVFSDIEGVLQSLQTTTSDPFSIKDYVGFGRVVSLSIVIGVIDVILMTAIATVMAFLYNICSALVGGVQLTLTDD